MCDRLNPLDFLLNFCFQSFLSFAGKQIQPTHNLQLLRFRPLCSFGGQWAICEGGDFREGLFVWVTFDDGIRDSPTGDATGSCKISALFICILCRALPKINA